MPVSVIRAKGQVTIPQDVREAAHLKEGDPVEIEITADGILLRPQKLIDASQAWFWTREWQQGEREASDDIRAGRVMTFGVRGGLPRIPRRLTGSVPTFAQTASVSARLRGALAGAAGCISGRCREVRRRSSFWTLSAGPAGERRPGRFGSLRDDVGRRWEGHLRVRCSRSGRRDPHHLATHRNARGLHAPLIPRASRSRSSAGSTSSSTTPASPATTWSCG